VYIRVAPGGGGGSCQAAGPPPSQNPQNQNLKTTDFVGIMISKVLCDFLVSWGQPLQSADD
jgi:hypothetical protein